MRIITLKAENVKRLRAIEVTPEGDVVVIAGRNAQGKSSVLDAIWMALAGAAGAKEITRPIRDGEEHASVELDLGDLLVTRKWTKAGTSLVVAAADGARYSSPQTILDGLIGRLSFDPLEFAEQDSKAQLRTLLDVVDLPFDPAHLDAQRKGIYDQRTDVNREVKRLETVLADIPIVPENTPYEEISAHSLAEKLSDALGDAANRDALEAAIGDKRSEVVSLEQRLADAKEALDGLVMTQLKVAERAPADVEAIRQEIAEVDTVNANVRAKLGRLRIAEELEKERENTAGLTRKLEAIDQEKSAAIANAKMPLEGLSFDDEGVLYNSVPFSQVSDSERLRVSIAIAMALNPKIRVIRITDGSLLDSENMKLIAEMAAASDFQVWVERVDETGEVGITIEDGAVAGA